MKISLDELVDHMEQCHDTWLEFWNQKTGEYEVLSDGTYLERDEELAEKIETCSEYRRLPRPCDIQELRIMRDFALSLKDEQTREVLLTVLSNRKPYRRFKDALFRQNMQDEYYAHKTIALYEIAEQWCEKESVSCRKRRENKS